VNSQAFQTGVKWLAGSVMSPGGNEITFTENTEQGKQLLRFPEVQDAMKRSLETGEVEPWSRNAGAEPKWQYIKGFASDLLGGNQTRALHGSIQGTAQYEGNYTFRVKASDTLGWQSMTRVPPELTWIHRNAPRFMNWTQSYTGTTYATNYGVKNNLLGSGGPGGNLYVNYDVKASY
jgi:hypothetical protein